LNYIRHTDWLGSSRLATTWAHAVYSKEAYAPFGETYNEAGTPDRSFTRQDQDVVTGSAGTGTYDFLFRKYDPAAGRWLSPDPSGWGAVDQTTPQSLNRYAYVQNNPMSMIDPEGLDCAWQNGDGTNTVVSGDCPSNGPGANGSYINCDNCIKSPSDVTFDANGDLQGAYSTSTNQFFGADGNPVTFSVGVNANGTFIPMAGISSGGSIAPNNGNTIRAVTHTCIALTHASNVSGTWAEGDLKMAVAPFGLGQANKIVATRTGLDLGAAIFGETAMEYASGIGETFVVAAALGNLCTSLRPASYLNKL